MKPIISIIVPIYNQEKYLRECLDSILAQTYTDFETILVDDGSFDSSVHICEEFVERDSRFRLVKKPNGGVSSARNAGLNIVRGEYVLFVDSDDKNPVDCLSNHLMHLTSEADLTMGAVTLFTEDCPNYYSVLVAQDELNTVSDNLRDFLPNGDPEWHRCIWNRLFRMSVIHDNQLKFNEKIFYKEDGLFLVQYLLRCSGLVAYFPETVYFYRQNPASAMGSLQTSFSKKLLTDLDAHMLIIKEMKHYHVASDILEGQIKHSFGARNWILEIMKSNGVSTDMFRIVSLIRLYCTTGVKYAIKHIFHHFCKLF